MRPEGRQSKIGSRMTTTNGDSRIVREASVNGHPLSVRIVFRVGPGKFGSESKPSPLEGGFRI